MVGHPVMEYLSFAEQVSADRKWKIPSDVFSHFFNGLAADDNKSRGYDVVENRRPVLQFNITFDHRLNFHFLPHNLTTFPLSSLLDI